MARSGNHAFFLGSLFWNLGHGMSWMALPLYAASQGLSNTQIGILISLPVLAQAPLNLAGGAYTDRIGGKRILSASAFAMTAAAVWLLFAQGFWMLILAQLGLAFSRAVFWPAAWATASELPGSRPVQLGRLNAVTNFGQIAGNLACGVLLAALGFRATFSFLALTAMAALVSAWLTPSSTARGARPESGSALLRYRSLLRVPIVRYSMGCAFISAVPFGLALSFYPLLLSQYGYADDLSGALLSLRSVGAIAAALIARRFVEAGAATYWPLGCGAAIVIALGALPVINHPAALGFWLLLGGVGAGAMTLFFQMTISAASPPEQRGSALALGGIGWNVSLLATPALMGFLADRFGLAAGFYVIAALTLCAVFALASGRLALLRPAHAVAGGE